MAYSADTLVYDAAKIAGYQADARFDYNSQLEMPDVNLAEIIFRWISRFFNRFVDIEVADTITYWFLIVFFVAAVFLIVFFIYKKRPGLFIGEKKRPIDYEVEDENIYGIDFEKELEGALAHHDFRMAIRILYLQTLRLLADRQYIDWQIYKVPTEYIYELKPVNLKVPFRRFTHHFLQVRYGNFKATGELFEVMKRLREELMEGGSGEA